MLVLTRVLALLLTQRAGVEGTGNQSWAEKGLGSVRRGRDSEKYPGGVTALNTEKLSTDNVYEATLPLRTQSWAGCQPERGCPNGRTIRLLKKLLGPTMSPPHRSNNQC